MLFWVGITQEVPVNQGSPLGAGGDTPITDLTVASMKGDTQVTAKATLYWTERYNGSWQPTRTSDVAHPVDLVTLAPGTFDRARLTLTSRVESDGGLRIRLGYPTPATPRGSCTTPTACRCAARTNRLSPTVSPCRYPWPATGSSAWAAA